MPSAPIPGPSPVAASYLAVGKIGWIFTIVASGAIVAFCVTAIVWMARHW